MNRLPKETFLLVTHYLDHEDRFQLAYTCKNWYSVISNYSLYESVYIDRDHKAPIAFFTDRKNYGSTVKNLQVNTVDLVFSQLKVWPDYFPNLQNLSLSIAETDLFLFDDYGADSDQESDNVDTISDPERENDEADSDMVNDSLALESDEEQCYQVEGSCFKQTCEKFTQWQKLASISEFSKFLYTGSILNSGQFPNLTSMDLDFNLVPSHASDAVVDHLLKGIKHTPNLQILKLMGAQLTLKKLDILHQNAPLLEALILEHTFLGQDLQFNELGKIDEEPCRLKRLEMQGNRYSFYETDDITIPNWLEYIAKKYPSIEIIKMHQTTPANLEYETPIIHVINSCRDLKTFNVDFCTFSASVLTAFDNTAIKLEKYSTQSQDLTELRNLSLSKQRHSIYRLDLVVPINNVDLIDILSQFTGLTTINTYPSSDVDYVLGTQLQVPLNRLLKQHKLLEFLSLSSCTLYLEENLEPFESVLDTLEMEKVTINSSSPNIFDSIASSCPRLQVMLVTARFSEHPVKIPTIINFSEHCFVYLKVYIEGHDRIRLCQKESTEWYAVETESRNIVYKPTDNALSEKKSGTIKAGSLDISAKRIERFTVRFPRSPFRVI